MKEKKSMISKIIDPFSVSAQMNNLGVLVIAYVANDLNQRTKCEDPFDSNYLNFILYGSTIVCVGTFLLSTLYMMGLIDYCINKVLPCGQVCLALNTVGIYILGVGYHFCATIYGLYEMGVGFESKCIELQMFKRITCTIYGIWFVGIVVFALFSFYREKMRSNINQLNQNMMEL